jgi:hypothetical protein
MYSQEVVLRIQFFILVKILIATHVTSVSSVLSAAAPNF